MGNDQNCTTAMWWVTLVVAVLAIPSAGFIITKMIPIEGGLGEIVVFVLACWTCTYLGMRLMTDPKFQQNLKKKD